MTDPLRSAARHLCALRGENPDDIVGGFGDQRSRTEYWMQAIRELDYELQAVELYRRAKRPKPQPCHLHWNDTIEKPPIPTILDEIADAIYNLRSVKSIEASKLIIGDLRYQQLKRVFNQIDLDRISEAIRALYQCEMTIDLSETGFRVE